jgi:O-acetyl-ADP-ribose deacetylase (regulator of RNase III)
MTQVRVVTGNIFTSTCKVLVNTVNCVGVMGAGLALEFRLRYPTMFGQYARLCEQGLLDVGKLWLFDAGERQVLNFPTKQHWRQPSQASHLRKGLQKFMQTYESRGLESVAFPLLGAQHGGLHPSASLALMREYLDACTVPVEIYRYDPAAPDDVFDQFKTRLASTSDEQLREATGLRRNQVRALRDALASTRVRQLNQLVECTGVGDKTLEAAFALTRMAVVPGQPGLL